MSVSGSDSIGLDELLPNHMCSYRLDLEDNEEFDQILKIDVDELKEVDVGLYYKSRWLNNTGLVQLGLIGEGKCDMALNCSLDSNNKYNYYISNSQELYLQVMAKELKGKRRDFESEVDLSLSILPVSNNMVTVYLFQTFFVLILSVVGFLLGMKYMVPEEEEEE